MEVDWEELVGLVRVQSPIYICNAGRVTGPSDEADTRRGGCPSEPGIEMLPRGLHYLRHEPVSRLVPPPLKARNPGVYQLGNQSANRDLP